MGRPALLTDLYELTMAASYVRHRMFEPATFDLFVRTLPQSRNFLIACGLEQALDYLETLRFDDRDLRALGLLGTFDSGFLDYLRSFRFSGEVWAIPEGEAAFHDEPLLRVTAPLPEAQFVESYLLNCISFQTMIASKAARLAIACGDRRRFVDFSLRRDHGESAAIFAARAAWIGGAAGSSNVEAFARFGIPASGTMAHSYVMAFEHEYDAFLTYARQFRERTVLLIDTFDIWEGARSAAQVARVLEREGVRIGGVRIDSGDFAFEARRVRALFEREGVWWLRIFLSGDLDEHLIHRLVQEDVPADAFGVGTQLGTSGDASSLGAVYKLAMLGTSPRMKLSAHKVTLPGRKQVFRHEEDGQLLRDVVGLEDERISGMRPVLRCVMRDGVRVRDMATQDPLEAARARCRRTLASLPASLRSLTQARPHDVALSPRLATLLERTRRELLERRGERHPACDEAYAEGHP